MCAVKRGHHRAIMFLLQRGASIDFRDSGHRTCLHVAAHSGNAETVDIILKVCAYRKLTSTITFSVCVCLCVCVCVIVLCVCVWVCVGVCVCVWGGGGGGWGRRTGNQVLTTETRRKKLQDSLSVWCIIFY